jgi:homoserine kinase
MIKVRVPASAANLGPGFDTLGVALALFLEVEMALTDNDNEVLLTGEGQAEIGNDPQSSLILKAARFVFQQAGREDQALKITARNSITIGKGLGSSASAIAAGNVCANHLLKNPIPRYNYCNGRRPWKAMPTMCPANWVGGLTTVFMHNGQVFYQKVSWPADMQVIVAVPDFALSTRQSRLALPASLSLADATACLQRACFLLAGLANGDMSNIAAAMGDDVFQKMRQKYIPGFSQVVDNAREAGALGTA